MTRDYRSLTHAEVVAAVSYCTESGEFRWRQDHGKYAAGTRAERKAAKGYLGVTINGAPVLCHRLAWFIVNGEWPTHDIDHRDTNRTNNRFLNLRHASRAVNMQNQRRPHRDTASGRLGVYFDQRRGKWYSCIRVGDRNKFLGYQENDEAAHVAYVQAKRQLHEGCTL